MFPSGFSYYLGLVSDKSNTIELLKLKEWGKKYTFIFVGCDLSPCISQLDHFYYMFCGVKFRST